MKMTGFFKTRGSYSQLVGKRMTPKKVKKHTQAGKNEQCDHGRLNEFRVVYIPAG